MSIHNFLKYRNIDKNNKLYTKFTIIINAFFSEKITLTYNECVTI